MGISRSRGAGAPNTDSISGGHAPAHRKEEETAPILAVLLAAGAGRKFWPYNEVRNKCAFPIGNVPAIRRLAEQLLQAGAGALVVVVGPRAGSVRAALAGLAGPGGAPAPVTFVEQPAPTG